LQVDKIIACYKTGREQNEKQNDPMNIFIYALRDSETRLHIQRFQNFLDFLKLPVTLEELVKQFSIKAKDTHPFFIRTY